MGLPVIKGGEENKRSREGKRKEGKGWNICSSLMGHRGEAGRTGAWE
jgi:hypothetical protein